MSISVSDLKNIITQHYYIEIDKIVSIEPGWAALAYKVYTNGVNCLLKVYDKNRNSTAYLLDAVPIYLFFIDWLNSSTSLKGNITRLINTKKGTLQVEDENYIYILMEYVEGHTVGDKQLTDKQIIELSDIISQLHTINPPVSAYTESITENFLLPWHTKLETWLGSQFEILNLNIRNVLTPFLSSLKKQIKELEIQAEHFREQDFPFVLCHTDIHNWNIIADENKIYLIDWEGIKYAPAEADLFGIYDEIYFPAFMEQYKKYYTGYEINMQLLQYYFINRNLTDIWEGIEQLQFDELSVEEYQKQLLALQEVCEENNETIKKFA